MILHHILHNEENLKKLEHFGTYKEEEKKLADLVVKFLHGREAHNMCAADLYIIEQLIVLFEHLFDDKRTEEENYMWLNWYKVERHDSR